LVIQFNSLEEHFHTVSEPTYKWLDKGSLIFLRESFLDCARFNVNLRVLLRVLLTVDVQVEQWLAFIFLHEQVDTLMEAGISQLSLTEVVWVEVGLAGFLSVPDHV